jgi:hypothetical protein
MVIWRIDRSLSLGHINPSEHNYVERDHSESTHLFMKYPGAPALSTERTRKNDTTHEHSSREAFYKE